MSLRWPWRSISAFRSAPLERLEPRHHLFQHQLLRNTRRWNRRIHQSPEDIAIDSFDNVWFANSQTGGNLSDIASKVAPATCVNLDAGAGSGIAIDSNYVSGSRQELRCIATAQEAFPTKGFDRDASIPGGRGTYCGYRRWSGQCLLHSVAGYVGSLYQLSWRNSSIRRRFRFRFPTPSVPIPFAPCLTTRDARQQSTHFESRISGSLRAQPSVSQVTPGTGPVA